MLSRKSEPCDNPTMGKHRCKNKSQCWEPCGDLGKKSENARVAGVIKPCIECVDSEPMQPCEACNGGWRVK